MARNADIYYADLPDEFKSVSRWRGSFDITRVWLTIALVAVACGLLGPWWVYAIGVIVIGILQNHLMVLWHHSIHYNIHPERRINDAIGRWTLIAPVGQPWGMMRRAHINHHGKLGERPDADRWYYDLDLHGRRRAGVFVGWLIANCLGGLLLPQMRKVLTGRRDEDFDPGTETSARDRYDQFAVIVCQAVLLAVFWALGGAWWTYFALWILPLVTLGGGLNCLRTALEHADAAEPPHRKYSFLSNPLERFIVAPFQMNYHWEHHKLLTVPYYKMPRLRRYLLAHGLYGEGRLVGSYYGRLRQVIVDLAAAF